MKTLTVAIALAFLAALSACGRYVEEETDFGPSLVSQPDAGEPDAGCQRCACTTPQCLFAQQPYGRDAG